MPRFQTTPRAARAIRDLALAAEVEAMLVQVLPSDQTTADNGAVTVTVKLGEIDTDPVIRNIRQTVRAVKGVRSIDVITEPVLQYSE